MDIEILDLLLVLSKDPNRREEFLKRPSDTLKAMEIELSEKDIPKVLNIISHRTFEKSQVVSEQPQVDFGTLPAELRDSAMGTVSQMNAEFSKILEIYQVAFYIGVVMIILSIVFGLFQQVIPTLFFGGLGIVDFLGFFIYRPAIHVQTGRSNLVKLEMALMNWMEDVRNWNAVSRIITTPPLSNQEVIECASRISSTLNSNLTETLKAIHDFANAERQVRQVA